MRIRETYGTSWRGSTPGTRHWRSETVSYRPWGGLFLLAGLLLWIPLWLEIEVYVLAVSGLVVLTRWAFDPSARFRCRFARWGWFRYLTA
jgi:hypothetical protein